MHFFILFSINIFIYINCEFNLFEIYPKKIAKSNKIKIVHKTIDSVNKTLCVFGVLESKNGKKIEKEMLEWLIPNYDVYIVYQKFPGKFFEYPAIKFAQYLINKKNKTLLLYIHTKGAFYPKRKNIQSVVRQLWKYEYSGKNKNKYISPILNNLTDVTTMFSGDKKITWFNGFFASKRAFKIIENKLKKRYKKRHKYETLFKRTMVRVLGIINNKLNRNVHPHAKNYLKYIKLKNKTDDL